MTPVSTRYAAPLLVLLALALVPVVVHSYLDLRHEDCADPAALLAEPEGTVVSERPGWPELEYRIRRSFEPSSLYLRPTRFLRERIQTDRRQLVWTERGGQPVPVYLTYDHSGSLVRIAAYTFVYDSRPVAHPFLAQLGSALPQLVTGTRPMTLFLVDAVSPRDRLLDTERRAQQWLADAWGRYVSVCLP